MAEVRRRLLRKGAQLRLIDELLPSGRALRALLLPIGFSQASSSSHRQHALWPSGAPRGFSVWVAGDRSGARFFSNGRRGSFHWTGSSRGSHGNRGQESELPLYRSRNAYYDILEVSINATQSQIKTAYYKQTFRFHPDRNAGNEHATRLFGEVTEAYHVLGSANLRRKYDRGILSLEDIRTAKKPNNLSSSRKEPGGQRPSSRTSSTSTPAKPMFDFDAFYQAHYGEQLQRERLWKAKREEYEREKLNAAVRPKEINEVGFVLLFITGIYLYLTFSG